MSRGTRRSRRVVTLALIAALGSFLLPSSVAQASPASASRRLSLGEPGSGPPSAPPNLDRQAMARTGSVKWSAVPAGFWARGAIDYVGESFRWMRDYPATNDGSVPFKPGRLETRKLFARAVVKAFAPDARIDPSITFNDLADDSPYYSYANVAVEKGWMRR